MLVRPNKPLPGQSGRQPHAETVSRQQQNTAQPQQQPEEPDEARAMKELLHSLGHTKYDPRVVHVLIDQTFRYASDLLEEAEAINIAAGGTSADLTPQDTALAAAQQARLRPQPPPLHELHALAAVVNAQPLTGPSDKQHGIKLPSVADCLLSQNYQLRPRPRAAPPPLPAAPPAGPPRQHFAVRQQPGRLAMNIPQQWQPAPAAAEGGTEPLPAQQQQQQRQQEPDDEDMPALPEEEAGGMDVDREDI